MKNKFKEVFDEFWEKYKDEIGDVDVDELLKEFLEEKAKEAIKELLKQEIEKTVNKIKRTAEETILEQIKTAAGNSITKDAYIPYLLKNLKLSNRIHNNVRDIEKQALKTINEHLQTKGTLADLRKKLLEGYRFKDEDILDVKAKLPKYLDKPLAKLKVMELKTKPLKAAYLQLLNSKTEEAFKKNIEVALWEKSRYFAERIAKTEEARVFAFSKASDILQNDEITLAKYNLCSCHKITDQCDFFASVDFGYGKGIYPKEEMVTLPLHPHCYCHYSKIHRTIKKQKNINSPYLKAFNNLKEGDKLNVFKEWGINYIEKQNENPVDVLNSFIPEDIYKINIFKAHFAKVFEDNEETYKSVKKSYEHHLKKGRKGFARIELMEEFDDIFDEFPLDGDEAKTIYDYTDHAFLDARDYYDGAKTKEGKKVSEKLEAIFNLYRPNFKKGLVYRGISLNKEKYDHYAKKDIGAVITDYSISSYSKKEDTAVSFMEGSDFEKKVFFKVVDIGDGGYDIKKYSYHKNEDEIIFPRFTMFQIINKYMQDGVLHFDLVKREDLKKRFKKELNAQ